MSKRVNIMVGRFQPFTKGHLKCIETVWRQTGTKTVLVMIDTPTSKINESHPFSSELLLPICEELFKHYNFIEKIILAKNANIVDINETLNSLGYEICSWVCGSDRYDSYKSMVDRYGEQINLPEDFKLIEIKRGTQDISATQVREALINKDYLTFTKLMPFMPLSFVIKYPLFDILSKEILKTYK